MVQSGEEHSAFFAAFSMESNGVNAGLHSSGDNNITREPQSLHELFTSTSRRFHYARMELS